MTLTLKPLLSPPREINSFPISKLMDKFYEKVDVRGGKVKDLYIIKLFVRPGGISTASVISPVQVQHR